MDVPPPEVLRKPLIVPHKVLMGPGPSNCPPRVLHALSQPILGHLHQETTEIMDEIKEGIRYIFQTRNELTLCVSTSGHGGIEAVMCNLLEPGEKVLIATNGVWGDRAANMAKRYGADVIQMKTEPGNNFSLEQLESAIMKHKPVMLFIVQGESSTGVYQPLEGLGDVCHSLSETDHHGLQIMGSLAEGGCILSSEAEMVEIESIFHTSAKFNCLLAVDTVASLGGVPLDADRIGIDAIYTGSQKVIGAPPGITPISFSDRAKDKIFGRKTEVKVFYWDMKILGDYWACFGRPRVYHHTISATLLYGLREALAMVAEEGIDNIIDRHQKCAKQLYDGLEKLGLELFVKDPKKRIPTVTTVTVPKDVDWKEVTAYIMKKYLVEVSGGLGPTTNKVFRIGLMGYNATPQKVDLVLEVMKEALQHSRNKMKAKL